MSNYIKILIILLVFIFSGCDESDSPTSTDQFTNKLTLGTGMDGFTITGETTNFNLTGGSVTIFWRLESSADMAGSNVNIVIHDLSSSSTANDISFTFTNPQSYGHIMLSSFALTNSGSYKATGILVNGNLTVASKDFFVH
ncbi:MAG: hypothetical protein JXA06_08935 [Bacteroidetes bacterium]|nr:hypothetical protein [Bacteroidota bacterium]